ncbi:MAG: hypothetical protein IPM82_15245 [Saprospiraceae bacterium]|nr:hypothetical protein [Saprospiraceae bacterium]
MAVEALAETAVNIDEYCDATRLLFAQQQDCQVLGLAASLRETPQVKGKYGFFKKSNQFQPIPQMRKISRSEVFFDKINLGFALSPLKIRGFHIKKRGYKLTPIHFG